MMLLVRMKNDLKGLHPKDSKSAAPDKNRTLHWK